MKAGQFLLHPVQLFINLIFYNFSLHIKEDRFVLPALHVKNVVRVQFSLPFHKRKGNLGYLHFFHDRIHTLCHGRIQRILHNIAHRIHLIAFQRKIDKCRHQNQVSVRMKSPHLHGCLNPVHLFHIDIHKHNVIFYPVFTVL